MKMNLFLKFIFLISSIWIVIHCKEELHVLSYYNSAGMNLGIINPKTGYTENNIYLNVPPGKTFYDNDTLYIQSSYCFNNTYLPMLVKIDLISKTNTSIKMEVALDVFVVSKGIIYGSKKKKKIKKKIIFFFFIFNQSLP